MIEQMKGLFSDRYGYTTPRDTLIREKLDTDIINALCTCYDNLEESLDEYDNDNRIYGQDRRYTYIMFEERVWCYFLNKRKADFRNGRNSYYIVSTSFLKDNSNAWYQKMNLLDFSFRVLRFSKEQEKDKDYSKIIDRFELDINNSFSRLGYAYRVIDGQIVQITDEEEVVAIEQAMKVSISVKTHLSDALKHLSARPNPDYRNSIKESISAVEAICRKITGENTLGKALTKLEQNGVKIPSMLQSAFTKLYVYTNDESTGIRHALMDDSEFPGFDEAKFMVVSCCAFINYIQGKRT